MWHGPLLDLFTRALGFASLALVPFGYMGDAWAGGLKEDYSGTVEYALTLPSNLGALAAGFNALQRTVRGAASA